jgi:hypothetical protein
VTEPEPVVARHDRAIGPDQLLAHERQQVPAHGRTIPLG